MKMSSNRLYMMPVQFGPHCGPRQAPTGGTYAGQAGQKQRRIAVRFLTSPALLESLLPPGFELWGDPIVTVEMAELRNVGWLAGRGYNTLGVAFPAQYQSEDGPVTGQFLSVLWENLADPILTGREQLGYSKIFADISDVEEDGDTLSTVASWDGFAFCSINVQRGEVLPPNPDQRMPPAAGEGLLHYKYIPRTGGNWDAADAAYATLSPWPLHTGALSETKSWVAKGTVKFNQATFDQMPTQFRIVNALADLPIEQLLPATVTQTVSTADYRNQKALIPRKGIGPY